MRKPHMPPDASGPRDRPTPAAGEAKRGARGHIGYLLRQAAGAFRLAMERSLGEVDVTPPQFLVLTLCRAYPGLSSADIARLAFLTPQTVTVIVGNLEKAGFVTRAPHAVHGRIQEVSITPAGLQRLAACEALTSGLEAAILRDLPPEEETVVRKWLVAVAVHCGEEKKSSKRD